MISRFRTAWRQIYFAQRGVLLSGVFLVLAWSRFRSHSSLEPMGLGIISLGMLLRFYAGRYIGNHSNGIQLAAENLATMGPYRFSRHPLYLANIITCLGFILFANSLSTKYAAGLFFIVVLHHALLVKIEEKFLLQSRGAVYQNYLNVTNTWIGLPRNRSVNTPIPGVWRRQGFNLAKSVLAIMILISLKTFAARGY